MSAAENNPETSARAAEATARPEILQGAEQYHAEWAPQPPITAPPLPPRHGLATATLLGMQSLLVTVVIAVFVITFLFQAFEVPSPSMENTLMVGDYLLVDKLHFARGGIFSGLLPYQEVGRGEIVVFHYPVNPAQYFVKRVIGVPGDRVRIVEKQVWVNGRPLREGRYAIHRSGQMDAYRDDFPSSAREFSPEGGEWPRELRRDTQGRDLVVPPGDYFVLGDNRDDSDDSRYWGFVPRANIVGRPLLVYFSLAGAEPEDRTPDGTLAGLSLPQMWSEIRWGRVLQVVQ